MKANGATIKYPLIFLLLIFFSGRVIAGEPASPPENQEAPAVSSSIGGRMK